MRRNCGDSRLGSKIPERVSLAEFRVGLRVEKKSKYFRKLSGNEYSRVHCYPGCWKIQQWTLKELEWKERSQFGKRML